jgi:hypothetical protein
VVASAVASVASVVRLLDKWRHRDNLSAQQVAKKEYVFMDIFLPKITQEKT